MRRLIKVRGLGGHYPIANSFNAVRWRSGVLDSFNITANHFPDVNRARPNSFKPRTKEIEGHNAEIVAIGGDAIRVNDTFVYQPVIVMQKSYLLWNVKDFSDITIENLKLVPMIYPTPEILVIGAGRTMPAPLSEEFLRYFRAKGISVEIATTNTAVGVFNFLNSEGRDVVGAFLPLESARPEFSIDDISTEPK